jgi:lipopolysaccharide transport system permease protein
MLKQLATHRGLVMSLIRRDIELRYKGSAFGLAWYVLNNLVILFIYTLVFKNIFKARWPSADGSVQESTGNFTLMLFCGLIIYNFVSECLVKAPSLIVSNPNYVKKVVFPLEILPVVAIGAACFNALVAFAVMLTMAILIGAWPAPTFLLAPLVLVPLIPIVLGVSWFLAAVSVYLRDVVQVVPLLTTVMLFTAPVFFPISAVPRELQYLTTLNPITVPIEQLRNVVFGGGWPDLAALGFATCIGLIIAWLGFYWFEVTKRGFADVL